jgi:flagellar motor component MotA
MALNGYKSGAGLSKVIGTALGAVGLVLSVLSALVALTNEGAPHAVLTALVGSATVAILVGVGLCEMAGWPRRPRRRQHRRYRRPRARCIRGIHGLRRIGDGRADRSFRPHRCGARLARNNRDAIT